MDKQTYLVADGVAWVNGARVPDSREVTLTEPEARFDLEQGRITAKDVIQAEMPRNAGKAKG